MLKRPDQTHPAPKTSRLRGPIRDFPIASLLSLSFGLLTALVVLAVLALTVFANVKNTFSLLNTRATETIGALTSLIDAHLEPIELTVRSLAGQIQKGELSLDDPAAMQEVLRGAISANRMVVVFQIYDREYRHSGVYRQGPVFGEIKHSTETNPKIRAMIDALPRDGLPHWGDIVTQDGVAHANVAIALKVKGDYVGTLVAAVPLPRLSALVREIGDNSVGETFVLDGGMRILAHPGLVSQSDNASGSDSLSQGETYVPRLPGTRTPGARSGMAEEAFNDPVLAAYADRNVSDEMFQTAARAGIEVSDITINDETYVIMSTAMTRYATRPWIVGVYFSRDTIGEQVRRLFGSTMVGLGLLVVGASAAFFLGRRMGRPFARLAEVARKVTTLDFDNIREMPPSRIREFNESSVRLNTMVDALRAFAAYVPRRLVTRLVEIGAADAARSHEQVLTLMFTDIVGFTALSEHMSAAETADFLNEHFAILCAEVDSSGGTVDKFMGDGMMAFWGAPDPLEDHAERACGAARKMAAGLARYNVARVARGERPVHLRIGIHSGPVIVGNIGPSDRMNYTIVGDTVNSCQRLEALGKVVAPEAECVTLISADTEAALPDAIGRTALSAFHVPGREAPIQVYRLQL